MKKIIKLTESDLHRIVKEAVKRILKEEDYRTPTGGFDVYAYKYDKALKDANSLEDWDKMMADRKELSDITANNVLNYHPERSYKYGGLGASKYVNPELYVKNHDNILDSLEADAEYGKKQYGFPF